MGGIRDGGVKRIMCPTGKVVHRDHLTSGPWDSVLNISMDSSEVTVTNGDLRSFRTPHRLNPILETLIIFWIKILQTMQSLISANIIPYLRRSLSSFIIVRELLTLHTMRQKTGLQNIRGSLIRDGKRFAKKPMHVRNNWA